VNEQIVIISGSSPLPDHVAAAIPEEAIVLAVDGGLDHALAAGLEPSGLIGDLDSVTEEALDWARRHATIAHHPVDKDRTDTELALAFAADMNPSRLTLVGGGDRLDHTVTAIGALGAPSLTSIPALDAWWHGQHLDVIHGPARELLLLEPGSRLSLVALHGPCTKVSITGVRWELDDAELAPVVGLGISNEAMAGEPGDDAVEVRVAVSTGVLTVFDQPASIPPLTVVTALEATR
jgi:thiamine pyrophosphokinase